MNNSAVILLSGGLDSTVLLHYVGRQLHAGPLYALSFHYGQKHSRELAMARWQAQAAAVAEHAVVDLTPYQHLIAGGSALVEGGREVPDLAALADDERRQPPTYVPNRNMVLLSLAAAFAESRQCMDVYYGAQAHDEYGYWDCTPDFVVRLNNVLALNRRDPVTVHAPFVGKRKAEGVRLGVELGVDFAHTWSCYRGGQQPCETCPTCVERRQAFAEAGVADPLCADAGDG
jgi:7-cyano-7-deazaguanine synthase